MEERGLDPYLAGWSAFGQSPEFCLNDKLYSFFSLKAHSEDEKWDSARFPKPHDLLTLDLVIVFQI